MHCSQSIQTGDYVVRDPTRFYCWHKDLESTKKCLRSYSNHAYVVRGIRTRDNKTVAIYVKVA